MLLKALAPELRQLHGVPQSARWTLLAELLDILAPYSSCLHPWRDHIVIQGLRAALTGKAPNNVLETAAQATARQVVMQLSGPAITTVGIQDVLSTLPYGGPEDARSLLLDYMTALTGVRGHQKYRHVTLGGFTFFMNEAVHAERRADAEPLQWPETLGELIARHNPPRSTPEAAALRLLEECVKLLDTVGTTKNRYDPQRWQRLAALSLHAGLHATPLPWGDPGFTQPQPEQDEQPIKV